MKRLQVPSKETVAKAERVEEVLAQEPAVDAFTREGVAALMEVTHYYRDLLDRLTATHDGFEVSSLLQLVRKIEDGSLWDSEKDLNIEALVRRLAAGVRYFKSRADRIEAGLGHAPYGNERLMRYKFEGVEEYAERVLADIRETVLDWAAQIGRENPVEEPPAEGAQGELAFEIITEDPEEIEMPDEEPEAGQQPSEEDLRRVARIFNGKFIIGVARFEVELHKRDVACVTQRPFNGKDTCIQVIVPAMFSADVDALAKECRLEPVESGWTPIESPKEEP